MGVALRLVGGPIFIYFNMRHVTYLKAVRWMGFMRFFILFLGMLSFMSLSIECL